LGTNPGRWATNRRLEDPRDHGLRIMITPFDNARIMIMQILAKLGG
jgi:hypothetical protein